MPIHDWTKVDAGIFHDFHHTWITEIKRALNSGVLPSEYYALAEQIAGGLGPDVLALQRPSSPVRLPRSEGPLAVATRPPAVSLHARRSEAEQYARKANAVVIRHRSEHEIVAVIEIVSPGNKSSRHALRSFVQKAEELLEAGVHLLIVDLFPPTPRDPAGLHREIWGDDREGDFGLTAARPLACIAYSAGTVPEVFLEPLAVGDALPEMPLFLTEGSYVPAPLDETYDRAWEAVPAYWREQIMT